MLIRSKTSMILVSLALLTLPPACDDDDSGDDAADTGGKGDDGGDGADDAPADGGDDAPADSGADDAPADSGADDAPADDGGATDIGETCEENADCADICVFAGDVDLGICTIRCESFSDCPDFWDCGPVGNASGDYCIPG